MIGFLLNRRHTFTVDKFLNHWGRELRDRVELITFQELRRRRSLRAGLYIFAGAESVSPKRRAELEAIAGAIESSGPHSRVLNHPAKVLRRYGLLKELHRRGINDFAVHRPGDGDIRRFPVFIRRENDHAGSRTPLIHSRDELQAQMARLERSCRDIPAEDWMVCDYVHTAGADGVFRKYAAFRIGDRIVPRHVLFSQNWVTKFPDLAADGYLEEERRFLDGFPHEEAVRAIFEVARVEYGRIDYALHNGRIQVWEVNTVPMIMLAPDELHPSRLGMMERVAGRITRALTALDTPGGGAPIPIGGWRSRARRLWGRLAHR
jgi:hypothetical protein